MNITQVKKRLDSAYERYRKEIEDISNAVFESRVKPFCLERQCNFVSGMGDYSVRSTSKDFDDDTPKSDKKWHSLREILDLPVDGLGDNCLGSYMKDFKFF